MMGKDHTTVADFIETLSKFPLDWPVHVATPAGGNLAIEHREIRGKPVIAIFGDNGGRFGENPLTEAEYEKQSRLFLSMLKEGQHYTSIHGDHRLYIETNHQDASCYGTAFDPRIVERMVAESLIPADIGSTRRYLAGP